MMPTTAKMAKELFSPKWSICFKIFWTTVLWSQIQFLSSENFKL